jgi:AcrR family transcriptional regulator
MSPRSKKQFEEIRREKTELILAAALRLFASKGYHSTTISHITREAGISKGLVYNYFESKESILFTLIENYTNIIDSMLNPDNDDQITNAEMEEFFHKLTQSMIKDQDYWKLYTQLTTQEEVYRIYLSKIDPVQSSSFALLFRYFKDRFENAEEELLLFTSVIKGFSLIMVYSPQFYSEELINSFLNRLKKMFIREKIKK